MSISRSTLGLAGLFAVSGIVHLVKPEFYEPLMPAWVPAHREVIVGSGVAELVCAAGLVHPRSRRPAGWASALVLVGVFPGNVQMALDSRRSRHRQVTVAAFARLPLQIPLVRAALRAAREG